MVNSKGDSRPKGGGVEEFAGCLQSSGWVSMGSGSKGSKGWAAGYGGRWRAAEAVASASGPSGGLQVGGTRRAMQSLYPAEWSSEQLGTARGGDNTTVENWFEPYGRSD